MWLAHTNILSTAHLRFFRVLAFGHYCQGYGPTGCRINCLFHHYWPSHPKVAKAPIHLHDGKRYANSVEPAAIIAKSHLCLVVPAFIGMLCIALLPKSAS